MSPPPGELQQCAATTKRRTHFPDRSLLLSEVTPLEMVGAVTLTSEARAFKERVSSGKPRATRGGFGYSKTCFSGGRPFFLKTARRCRRFGGRRGGLVARSFAGSAAAPCLESSSLAETMTRLRLPRLGPRGVERPRTLGEKARARERSVARSRRKKRAYNLPLLRQTRLLCENSFTDFRLLITGRAAAAQLAGRRPGTRRASARRFPHP